MREIKNGALVGGRFIFECFDRLGNLKWKDVIDNILTDEGLNKMLDSTLHDDASATWYVLVFEDDVTPDGDTTYAVPVFTECEAYDEGTRPEYVEAAAAAKSISNTASKATFTFNATKTIYGGALVDHNVKGNTAEAGKVMLGAGQFSASKPVESTDVLKVTYTVTAADDGV